MKTWIHFMIMIIPIFGYGQSLVPEAHWTDGNHRAWCDKGIGTAFTSYNGILTSFNYQGNGTRNGGHVYMYTIDEALKTSQTDLSSVKMSDFKLGPSSDNNNKIVFGFPGEGSSYDEGPVLGRAFFFQYQSQTWYFIHIRSANQCDHCTSPDNDSYECYARIPDNTTKKCFTYYLTSSPVSTVQKQGAFQLDSLVYFLAIDKSALPNRWQLQEFRLDSTNGHFKYNDNTIVISALTYPFLGGLYTRLDSVGNTYFVATFYDQAGNWQVGKLVPGISGGKRKFTWYQLLDSFHSSPFTSLIAATAIYDGTIKGNRVSNDITNKAESDRMILFGQCGSKSSDGYYHVQYGEYHFQNEMLVKDGSGEIQLPSSNGAYNVGDYFQLYASYMLQPKDYQSVMSGTDGYQQYMWLLYPDHNKYFNAAMFQSDFWSVSPDYKYSPDLDDDITYPGISSLWTLVGIVDGPPPVTMNWHKWDSTWGYPVYPTMMELESDSSGASEFTTQTENEWSAGLSVDVKSKRDNYLYEGSIGGKLKFSQTFDKTVSSSETHSVTYTSPFNLEEDSQVYGYYLYIIPEIKRYSFSLFPWWDDPTQQKYPVDGSFQYLFQTIANKFLKNPVPISAAPFNIAEPNAPDMAGWYYNKGRKFLMEQAGGWGLVPVISLSWKSPGNGNSMNIQTSTEAKQSDSQTNTWGFEVEAGYSENIPDVCKIDIKLSTGYTGSLMSETSSVSDYGHKIFASLEQLSSQLYGVNVGQYSMDGYLFTNDVNPDWWFNEGLNNQKPFYFAWVVNDAEQSLITVTPPNGGHITSNDLIFSWRPDHGTLQDYELLISKSTPIANPNIIYRKMIGDATETSTPDFIPEPGTTYYWSVKSHDQDGNIVYAPVSSFTLPKVAKEPLPVTTMCAVICSNPGTSEDLRIVVNPASDGPVSLSLMSLSGTEVYRKEVAGTANQVIPFSFAGAKLSPGLYFAVIQSADERVMKKIIIH
ncbi:MAG: T9SS type A sorting domain-containing protein [Bacteroidetes bacterium]|nr:T9SS type A sorting domain-containing protein [Bacteroidota bacterium]